MKRETKITVILLLSILFMAAHPVYGVPVISDNLAVSCLPSESNKKLNCDYRLKTAEPVLAITASGDDKTLSVSNTEHYPWKDAVTAILLVIDTSDPARQNVIDQNKKDIASILGSSSEHHRIGLASFNKALSLEVPIGTSNEQIKTAAERLRAIGQTTELYRSVLTAIDLLGKVKADRKSVYLFSDGLAEDTAYFHNDVIKAAKQTGVVITGLGYPRSVALSVALQTLRRLSDETGGQFIEVDRNLKLPEAFLNNPFDSIDNGGRFNIDLSSLLNGRSKENFIINLLFETDTGKYQAEIPVSLPITRTLKQAEPTQPAQAGITPAQALAQQPVVITRELPAGKINLWLWYGIPAALIILLIITIAAFFLIINNQDKKRQAVSNSYKEFKPYAYLVFQDETKKRYPITNTIWRIGRSTDNEMTLRDSSVSRRHAEIDRDKGDIFTITDLGSLNGVYVNNKKTDKQILREGDIIEIGDINLRFTLLPADYTFEEVTEMQNTRAPFTH